MSQLDPACRWGAVVDADSGGLRSRVAPVRLHPLKVQLREVEGHDGVVPRLHRVLPVGLGSLLAHIHPVFPVWDTQWWEDMNHLNSLVQWLQDP